MKLNQEKQIEQKKDRLYEKIGENEKLAVELQAEKDNIYESLKDFTLSANKTEAAMAKMRDIDAEIKRIKNKIRKDNIAYDKL
jgi:hypothetical protein